MNAWTLDPIAIAVALVALGALVTRRVARPALFAASIASVIVALVSPLAFLARGVFFSAHMAQHLLLVLVAPPLLLASLAHEAPSEKHEGFSVRTVLSWALGVSAMWLWHAPTLCNAASQSTLAFHAQTISLLAMGAAFFWPIFGMRAAHRLPVFGALAYLFTACAACTVLGIGITFSPVEVCSVFARPSAIREAWNVSTKADQEVGGLLMWVPGCLVYASCIVFMYGRYARAEGVAKEQSGEA
jgi:cytochrome c oxidase assembly factor CtaG